MLLGDYGKPLPMQKETTMTSVCEPSTTMEKYGEDSDSDEVEDIDDNMAWYMANPNRAGGWANDASLF